MTRLRQHANCLAATAPVCLPARDEQGRFVAEPTYETIRSYWRDPAPFEAEQAANRARANAAIDAAVRRNHPHIAHAAKGEI